MKFAILSLALLAVVAADVSHLNNKYLPPLLSGLSVRSHTVEYPQQSQEVPQLAEVTDNSVVEEATAEKDVKTTGKIFVENVKFGSGYAGDIQVQEEKKYYTGAIEVPQQEAATTVEITEDVATPAAPGSDVYESTQQQAAYWTGVSQQQEANVATEQSEETVAATEEQHQQQEQQSEQKYYTGLIVPQETAETVVEQEEAVAPAAPGSDVYESTQQQAAYWTQQSQQQQQEEQVTEKKYYTGLIIPQGSSQTASTTTTVETAVIPGSDDFTQQQAAYHTQQQEVVAAAAPLLGVRASSGIETQYATDGGYVY